MDASRLRVLLYTNLFPTPSEPTRGIFTWQLARELRCMCDLTVVCPLPWFPRWSFLRRLRQWYEYSLVPREYEFEGIQVYSPKYLMLPKISEPFLGLLMFLGTILTVWKLHRRKKFNVVNPMWLYPDAVSAGWIGRLLGIQAVPTALGCDVNLFLDEPAKRSQILAMLRRSRKITAVSEALRARMIAEGIEPARIWTTPNGVDTTLFHVRGRVAACRELGLPEVVPSVLYVGRLSEEKGLSTLVDAAGRLLQSGRKFMLYFVGDGPELGALRARAHGNGLGANVQFLGHQDHSRVALWVAACNVFCLPSLREGCPNVVLESLSSGRPVVASRVGAIPDLVGGESGILVDPGNALQLADALGLALDRSWDAARIAATTSGKSWRSAAYKFVEAYRLAAAEASM